MPVARRGARSACTSRSADGRRRARRRGRAPPGARARPAAARGARSSTSVFHSPQAGHWPCHLAATWAQEAQTKTVSERAIGCRA